MKTMTRSQAIKMCRETIAANPQPIWKPIKGDSLFAFYHLGPKDWSRPPGLNSRHIIGTHLADEAQPPVIGGGRTFEEAAHDFCAQWNRRFGKRGVA